MAAGLLLVNLMFLVWVNRAEVQDKMTGPLDMLISLSLSTAVLTLRDCKNQVFNGNYLHNLDSW